MTAVKMMKKVDKKYISKSTPTSWGNVANWYDRMVEGEGSYQRDLILPNLLRLMVVKSGDKIADVACGQGFFARELVKVGAVVSAFDISPELLKIGRERSANLKITFTAAPADKLPAKSGEFDKAIIVLALQDVENLDGAVNEISRILKANGEFFVVINHPAFRIPKRTAWLYDEKRKIQSRAVDEYMSESRVKMEVHPGVEKSELTTYFHRPLQTYFKSFQKAGFVVSRLEEWVSDKKSGEGPRANAENKARREFPLFMAVVLKKLEK